MTHQIKYLTIEGTPPLHTAHCKPPCNWHADRHEHQWQVEDEWTQHLADVERIKAHLGTSTPSLKMQRDYYQHMAENDPETGHRPIWKMLADGLSHRLGDGERRTVDEQLPFG